MSARERTSRKPTIRIVRNLARSGGTLIGKCIGCMEGVTLLSELHPKDLRTTKPMMQARDWFGLITHRDIVRWKVRAPSVLQFVSICETRAKAKHRTLVLRDWSHLDYIGAPYASPGMGFGLGEALAGAYEIRVSTTTRHPIDQYLSLVELPQVREAMTLDGYLRGCVAFAEFASAHGFHRYEDFTRDPDSVLRAMCAELDLDFDGGYREKWSEYTTITGDTVPGVGRGSTRREIRSLPRKPIGDGLLAAFRASGEYQRACALLGYEP